MRNRRWARCIPQALEQAGTIHNAILFQIGVRLRGKSAALKAGEYEIPSHASKDDITDILVSGKSIEHKMTAAEGLTSEMIFDLVSTTQNCRRHAEQPAEGSLLPETYFFIRGTTRAYPPGGGSEKDFEYPRVPSYQGYEKKIVGNRIVFE